MSGRLNPQLVAEVRSLIDDLMYAHGVSEHEAQVMLAAALADRQRRNRIIASPEVAAMDEEVES